MACGMWMPGDEGSLCARSGLFSNIFLKESNMYRDESKFVNRLKKQAETCRSRPVKDKSLIFILQIGFDKDGDFPTLTLLKTSDDAYCLQMFKN